MLAMTKKTGYGLIAMTHLAGLVDGRVASAREIAERFGIPTALLMKALKQLAAAGYVSSVRGARGGYRLARRPEDIDMASLVTAIEGPIRLADCLTERDLPVSTPCKLMDRCPIADPVHRIQRKLNDFLQTVTLADIAEPAGLVPKRGTSQ